MKHIARTLLLLLTAIVLAVPTGCGKGRGSVSGTVTYKGKPLGSGSVLILGSDGVRAAPIDEAGSYEVKDIAVGSAKVLVNSPCPDAPASNQSTRLDKKNVAVPPIDASRWFPIPAQYASFDTSELSVDIKPGRNAWDIELK